MPQLEHLKGRQEPAKAEPKAEPKPDPKPEPKAAPSESVASGPPAVSPATVAAAPAASSLPARSRCPDCGGPVARYEGENPHKQGSAFCATCGKRVNA